MQATMVSKTSLITLSTGSLVALIIAQDNNTGLTTFRGTTAFVVERLNDSPLANAVIGSVVEFKVNGEDLDGDVCYPHTVSAPNAGPGAAKQGSSEPSAQSAYR